MRCINCLEMSRTTLQNTDPNYGSSSLWLSPLPITSNAITAYNTVVISISHSPLLIFVETGLRMQRGRINLTNLVFLSLVVFDILESLESGRSLLPLFFTNRTQLPVQAQADSSHAGMAGSDVTGCGQWPPTRHVDWTLVVTQSWD